MMYLSGFADEASDDIDRQIEAHRELGWDRIDLRWVSVDGCPRANINDIDPDAFETIARRLDAAGLRVDVLGTKIADHSKRVIDPFARTLEEVDRAIPRMRRLGCTTVRLMSYAVVPGEELQAAERFRRMREVVSRFVDAGLTPVHENCGNYGGLSPAHTLELLKRVPGLRLCFDTGNPIGADDRSKPKPHPKQEPWDFYSAVREHVVNVHIKDAVRDVEGRTTCVMPGQGLGDIPRIVGDLHARGYDGALSLEPHFALRFLKPEARGEGWADELYAMYLEAGQHLEKIFRKATLPALASPLT